MFYETVKAAFEAGKVRVGVPALGCGDRITIEADGLIGLKAAFLTNAERKKLAEWSAWPKSLLVEEWTPAELAAVRRSISQTTSMIGFWVNRSTTQDPLAALLKALPDNGQERRLLAWDASKAALRNQHCVHGNPV
ncbi:MULTISPECIES: hypothetical protein [unclassified Pseudomonas]|uniref:hypothetical protein n=1 Tax=unclassified Pseudomonas TaxID=196821 RepID=UPI0011BF7750|nr:hypothetical protein [Pseudomonas sp. MWU12-2020]